MQFEMPDEFWFHQGRKSFIGYATEAEENKFLIVLSAQYLRKDFDCCSKECVEQNAAAIERDVRSLYASIGSKGGELILE